MRFYFSSFLSRTTCLIYSLYVLPYICACEAEERTSQRLGAETPHAVAMMKSPTILLLIFYTVGVAFAARHNVMRFGAKGDGRTDDAKAFLDTWNAACGDAEASIFEIPRGKTFLLGPINFLGPCRSNQIHMKVDGTLLRPNGRWGSPVESWILFNNIQGLAIYGEGLIDGQGKSYWDCKNRHQCSVAPDALTLLNCNNLRVSGLRLRNSPQKQLNVGFSAGVILHGLTIAAPGDSPNTDGLHVEQCRKVEISNSIIAAGDDCISIGNGTFDVKISEITCGPGHGISVGSLGAKNSRAQVEKINVSKSRIFNTTYGVRIKTWQGGSGYARGMAFRQINFTHVQFPIIIDQYYCPHQTCANKTSAVQLSDVRYIGLRGTSSNDVAIGLWCSESAACRQIKLQHVNFRHAQGRRVHSNCINARGTVIHPVIPDVPCLR